MQKIDEKEYKGILVELLDFVTQICKKNNIKYSLIGGSLIGAIRHKGIIPWDDDIDIILYKDEYQKLIDILKEIDDDRFELLDSETNETYYYPFAKLVDKRTIVKEFYNKPIENYGVYLDIFRYDNAPNNKIIRKLHYFFLKIEMQLIFGYCNVNISKGKGYIRLKKIRNVIAKKLGRDRILNMYNRLCNRYNKKETKYIISNWTTYGAEKEYQLKSDFRDFEYVRFENIEAQISKNYDSILKTTFGDYMTPPPIEKRESMHVMEAFRK